jgi:hypothetical protein
MVSKANLDFLIRQHTEGIGFDNVPGGVDSHKSLDPNGIRTKKSGFKNGLCLLLVVHVIKIVPPLDQDAFLMLPATASIVF